MSSSYDLIFDIAGNRSVSDYTACVASQVGPMFPAPSPRSPCSLGPLMSISGSKKVVQLSHSPSAADLAFMSELLEAGKVVPVIDKSYPLSEAC